MISLPSRRLKCLPMLSLLGLLAWVGLAGAPAPAASGEPLSWAPPELEAPITIDLARVIQERAGWSKPAHLKLDLDKDYVIDMPDEPLTTRGGLGISGGRNVVVIGGEIRLDEPPAESALDNRAVYINRSTGTVHIEGLWIHGDEIREGFNIDVREPGAIVQIQNVRVEGLQGTREGHHADVVQTWAGPTELRIDRLTGISQYQGFFLHPYQFWKEGEVRLFDFRRMNVTAGGYIYWQAKPFPIQFTEVWAQSEDPSRQWPELVLWPKNDPVWEPVRRGTPPDGDFVPAGAVGVDYVSPGYVSTASSADATGTR